MEQKNFDPRLMRQRKEKEWDDYFYNGGKMPSLTSGYQIKERVLLKRDINL